jgi:hypothetical protein
MFEDHLELIALILGSLLYATKEICFVEYWGAQDDGKVIIALINVP